MWTSYVIFAFCMIGCAGHSYFLGRKAGITFTVQYLVDRGLIEVVEEDD